MVRPKVASTVFLVISMLLVFLSTQAQAQDATDMFHIDFLFSIFRSGDETCMID